MRGLPYAVRVKAEPPDHPILPIAALGFLTANAAGPGGSGGGCWPANHPRSIRFQHHPRRQAASLPPLQLHASRQAARLDSRPIIPVRPECGPPEHRGPAHRRPGCGAFNAEEAGGLPTGHLNKADIYIFVNSWFAF